MYLYVVNKHFIKYSQPVKVGIIQGLCLSPLLVPALWMLSPLPAHSRTLTAVHDAILEDLVHPAEIVGKRIRIRLDGSRLTKVWVIYSNNVAIMMLCEGLKWLPLVNSLSLILGFLTSLICQHHFTVPFSHVVQPCWKCISMYIMTTGTCFVLAWRGIWETRLSFVRLRLWWFIFLFSHLDKNQQTNLEHKVGQLVAMGICFDA